MAQERARELGSLHEPGFAGPCSGLSFPICKRESVALKPGLTWGLSGCVPTTTPHMFSLNCTMYSKTVNLQLRIPRFHIKISIFSFSEISEGPAALGLFLQAVFGGRYHASSRWASTGPLLPVSLWPLTHSAPAGPAWPWKETLGQKRPPGDSY